MAVVIPHSVLAAGWIPFVVIIVLAFLFSWFYIRYYQSRHDSEVSSTLTAIAALAITLLTSALVPVDIFLVSYMKTSDGHFKPWAADNQTRQSIEDAVLYSYYALYCAVMAFAFLLIPFMYFFYEEKDEDSSCRSRCCAALKFTVAFIIVAAILLLIGALAPLSAPPAKNSTDWERLHFLFNELGSNHGEDAISFAISSLTLLGMLALITYTAYGMTALPFTWIKGVRAAKRERLEVCEDREELEERRNRIHVKYQDGRRMTSRDRREMDDLDEKLHLLRRRERHLLSAERSWLNKCFIVCRPFQMVFGIVFILLALIIFVSLLLSCIDRILHGLGYKMGYALPKPQLPNPVDIVMVNTQKVFPLDYILISAIIMYWVFCSMAGIKQMGIWFFWIRMYKIRVQRTRPQALLFMCMILMLIVLTNNIMLYTLSPQYVTFGSQHYWHNETNHATNETFRTLVPCNLNATQGECTMTRMSTLTTRFFYKVWFFGACYYWGTWGFLVIFVLGFIVSVVKGRRSAIEDEVESDDSDESDEELLRA
ncbi:probable lysosomal cobalamin transporter [Branchiostoma lanceolatum]|uniref:probable lysosomal cobalamin transporter n=1 Tax=Branchiostoma lanceolatum TaxID=7740 RepID=UPI00345121C4